MTKNMKSSRKAPTTAQAETDEAGFSASVDRAARVLAAFSETHEPLSLPTISQLAELDKSTTFRVLCTLVIDGLVTQDEMTGVYTLSFLPLRFADTVLETLPIRAVARPVLNDIFDRINETVALSLREGWSRVNIEYLCGNHAVVQTQLTGVPFPLHVGAPGLAILASLSDEERTQYLRSKEFEADKASRVSKKAILQTLDDVARRGYVVSEGQCTPGGIVLAAPFTDGAMGAGAVHIAVPAGRWSPEMEKRCAALVIEGARKISEGAQSRS